MKRFGLAILIFALLLASPSLALAQEGASYSLASAQESKNLQVIPGTECHGVIYFYNVDGNRITHITLEVSEESQFPDSWEVEIDPPLQDQPYEVGGQTIYVAENLYAEPTEVSAEEIADVPLYCQEHGYTFTEGMVSLTLPNKLGEGIPGYALAKPVYIIVRVPESEEIGTEGDIRINAVGGPPSPTGTVTVALTRDFDFTVNTVYELTNEKPITGGGFDVGKWLPVIIAGAIVILAAVLLPRFAIRRRER